MSRTNIAERVSWYTSVGSGGSSGCEFNHPESFLLPHPPVHRPSWTHCSQSSVVVSSQYLVTMGLAKRSTPSKSPPLQLQLQQQQQQPPRRVTPHKKDVSAVLSLVAPNPPNDDHEDVDLLNPPVASVGIISPNRDVKEPSSHHEEDLITPSTDATTPPTTTTSTTTRRKNRSWRSPSSSSSSLVHRKKQQHHHQHRYRYVATPLCMVVTVGLYMARQPQEPKEPQQHLLPAPRIDDLPINRHGQQPTAMGRASLPPLLSSLARDVQQHSGYSWIHAPPPRPGTL